MLPIDVIPDDELTPRSNSGREIRRVVVVKPGGQKSLLNLHPEYANVDPAAEHSFFDNSKHDPTACQTGAPSAKIAQLPGLRARLLIREP
jgi:hypothetical protein